MVTFLKANASSLIASTVDYFITILLSRFFNFDVVLASMIGTVCGGITNFLIGKHWVFSAGGGNTARQALKYIIVWCGNLVLNTSGMYVCVKLAHMHDIISKVIVSLIVAFGYNYPLQKKYVFKV